MAKWLSLPNPPIYSQADQLAFLDARRKRWCKTCKTEYQALNGVVTCPTCNMKGRRVYDILSILAGRRFGKRLAWDTEVPTVSGWKCIAEIQVGDVLFDETGAPTTVTAVTPVEFGHPCYRIRFSDGTSVVADEDHQWLTYDKSARKALGPGRRISRPARRKRAAQTTPRVGPKVRTTKEIAGTLWYGAEANHSIPVISGPVQCPERELPIDPYVLGVWLGDGSKDSSIIHCVDPEIHAEIQKAGFSVDRVGGGWVVGREAPSRSEISGRFQSNGSFQSQLKALGLLGNKHVPSDYLMASPAQRLALLQGLMDTDGSCTTGGHFEFCNTNQNLSEAVYELLTSLGVKAATYEGRARLYGEDCGPKWRVCGTTNLPIFRLPRKLSRIKAETASETRNRYVVSVEKVESVASKCLEVDSPNNLFLITRSFVPTHNSRFGSISGVEEATVPNTIGWACAPTNPKLHRYVIPAFQQLIPNDWVASWNSEFLDLRLKNGSLIHFQTLEHPDQGRGQGLDWLWIDEVCELTKDHWDVISPSLGDKQGVAFFTTSPRGFDWVYEKLYQPADQGIPGFWALHTKTSANPLFQTDEGRAFLERARATMPPEMYAQEYEAEFVVFEGAVYGSMLDSQQLFSDDQIRQFIPEWPRIDSWRTVLIGIDTGADHPFGAVKLVTGDDGNLLVVGEYLERHKSFIEHANALKHLAAHPQPKWAINKNERQPMLEFYQHGISATPAANDQIAGIERVKSWLFNKKLWFVTPLCPKTVQQMKSLRWDKNVDDQSRKTQIERVYKKDDELPDCVRYALMTWPQLPVPPAEEVKPRDLSKLNPEIAHSIARMRRIDNQKPEPETVMGDFWG